jgi:hypothetical protein
MTHVTTIGLWVALLVVGPGAVSGQRIDTADVRVPRVRFAVGVGKGMDVSMTYSRRVGERTDFETGLLFGVDRWRRVERQTRCSELFGCWTGTFVTEDATQTSITALARWLRYDATGRLALVFGGGPAILQGTGSSVGLVFDTGLSLAHGTSGRWTTSAGFRLTVGPGDSRSAAAWYIRGGLAVPIVRRASAT